MSQGWSDEEVKHLRDIRLDPKQNSREKLQALVRHFRTPNASVFAVSGGIGEVSVSRELARKVRDLTREGKLNWLLNNTQVAAYLAIGEPQVGRWVHNGGEALYATLSVRAVSALERNCWASLEILEPEGRRFPLHWAGLSYTISETQPVYLDIASDVPARLDVAFVFPRPGGTGSNARPSPGHGLRDDRRYGAFSLQGIEAWDGKGCWIAMPLALSSPDPNLRAFLKPGEYRVFVRIYCRNDVLGFESEYLLTSPERADGLTLRRTPLRSA